MSRNGPNCVGADATVMQKRPRWLGSSDVQLVRTAEYANHVVPILITPGAQRSFWTQGPCGSLNPQDGGLTYASFMFHVSTGFIDEFRISSGIFGSCSGSPPAHGGGASVQRSWM